MPKASTKVINGAGISRAAWFDKQVPMFGCAAIAWYRATTFVYKFMATNRLSRIGLRDDGYQWTTMIFCTIVSEFVVMALSQ
jgi:hypothetical protein